MLWLTPVHCWRCLESWNSLNFHVRFKFTQKVVVSFIVPNILLHVSNIIVFQQEKLLISDLSLFQESFMNRALHHVIMTRDAQAWYALRCKIDEAHLSQFTDSLTMESSIQRQFNEKLTSTLSEHAAQTFGENITTIVNINIFWSFASENIVLIPEADRHFTCTTEPAVRMYVWWTSVSRHCQLQIWMNPPKSEWPLKSECPPNLNPKLQKILYRSRSTCLITFWWKQITYNLPTSPMMTRREYRYNFNRFFMDPRISNKPQNQFALKWLVLSYLNNRILVN